MTSFFIEKGLLSAITAVESDTYNISTYGGKVYCYKINRVVYLTVSNLGETSTVHSGAWRYIDLNIASKYRPIFACYSVLKAGGSFSDPYICFLNEGTLSFYCYSDVTSGIASFSYISIS